MRTRDDNVGQVASHTQIGILIRIRYSEGTMGIGRHCMDIERHRIGQIHIFGDGIVPFGTHRDRIGPRIDVIERQIPRPRRGHPTAADTLIHQRTAQLHMHQGLMPAQLGGKKAAGSRRIFLRTGDLSEGFILFVFEGQAGVSFVDLPDRNPSAGGADILPVDGIDLSVPVTGEVFYVIFGDLLTEIRFVVSVFQFDEFFPAFTTVTFFYDILGGELF